MSEKGNPRSAEAADATFSDSIRSVLEALNKLRFGTIQLTVHEGKLVQVDVTERKRFTA